MSAAGDGLTELHIDCSFHQKRTMPRISTLGPKNRINKCCFAKTKIYSKKIKLVLDKSRQM